MKKLFLIIGLCVFISPHLYAEKRHGFKMTLTNVEVQYGTNKAKQDSKQIENKGLDCGLNLATWADSIISISWLYHPTLLEFTIKNISNESLKIIWDETIFVDNNNESHKIFHKGVKIINRENPQSPTTIVKGSKVDEILIPVNNVEFNSYLGRWMYTFIFGTTQTSQKQGTLSVLLTVATPSQPITYLFSFDVNDIGKKINVAFNDGAFMYLVK